MMILSAVLDVCRAAALCDNGVDRLFSYSCVTHIPLFRVTTCLENLEMSGNLVKVRELSWKISSGKMCP